MAQNDSTWSERLSRLALGAFAAVLCLASGASSLDYTEFRAQVQTAVDGMVTVDEASITMGGTVAIPAYSKTIQGQASGTTLVADASGPILSIGSGGLGKTITLNNLILERDPNVALNANGGGINIINSKAKLVMNDVTIRNHTLSGNSTVGMGGAIYAQGDLNAELTRVTIDGNKTTVSSSARSAGINVTSSFTGFIDSSTFQNNVSAAYEGGAFLSMNFTGNITNSFFLDNENKGGGAALQVGALFDGDIRNTEFSRNINTTGEGGGAVRIGILDGSIVNSKFTDNSSPYYGGALYVMIGEANAITGSVFTGNSSGDMGGAAFFIQGVGDTITDTVFHNNSAAKHGGAVMATKKLHFVNPEFIGNTSDWEGGGGAVAIQNGDITLEVEANKTSLIAGNYAGSTPVPNAVHVNKSGSLSIVTHSGSTLDMTDAVETLVATDKTISVVKEGAGTWKLGGESGFYQTATPGTSKSTFEVREGTLHLYGSGEAGPDLSGIAGVDTVTVTVNDAKIGLFGDNSTFTLGGAATLSLGGTHLIQAGGDITFGDGATIVADRDVDTGLRLVSTTSAVTAMGGLAIDVAQAGTTLTLDTVFAEGVAGTGKIVKTGDGCLKFAQQDAATALTAFSLTEGCLVSDQAQTFKELNTSKGTNLDVGTNALTMDKGSLAGSVKAGDFTKETAGTLDIAGKMELSGTFRVDGGAVGVNISQYSPAITADQAIFAAGTSLKVTGYTGTGGTATSTVIATNSNIAQLPDSMVLDGTVSLGYDFLYGGIGRSADGQNIEVTSGLYWYHEEQDLPQTRYIHAHGTFEVDANDSFRLDTVLNDRDKTGKDAWDGKCLEKLGDGVLELHAESNYTGGSTVKAGTLAAFNGKALGTGEVVVDNNAVLAFNLDGTVANDVSGAGGIASRGAVLLTGDHSLHTGTVNVLSGSLGLGALSGPAVDSGAFVRVADGAVLHGNGSMTGLRVERGGHVSPGHSIGTLTVNGDALFEAGSFYDVEVNPADTADADLLAVTGTADLGGATVRHVGALSRQDFPAEGEWVILTAAGGFGNTRFADAVEGDYIFLDQSLDYRNNNTEVALVISRNASRLLDFAMTRNQTAVAGALGGLASLGSDLYNTVIALPAGTDVADVYDQLSGELHPTVRGMLVASDQAFGATMLRRVVTPALPEPGFPVWARVEGFRTTLEGARGVADGKHKGVNLTLGAERQSACGWLAGAAFRYGNTDVKVSDRHSRADIDSFIFGLYGGRDLEFAAGKFRMSLGASYGFHDVDGERNIRVPQLAQRLRSDYHAHSVQALADVGFAFTPSTSFEVEPYLRSSWNSVWTNGFTEKGGNAALRGQSEHKGVFAHTAGLRTRVDLGERLSFRAGAGWRHAYGADATRGGLRFVEGGGNFRIDGVTVPRDAAVLDASLHFRASENLDVSVGYDGVIGAKVWSHAANLTIQYSF